MVRRGFRLETRSNRVDWDKGEGKTTTAIFTGAGKSFECTRLYENEAVCVAALMAIGVSLEIPVPAV